MGVEIERKFLVNGDSWRCDADAGVLMEQGYFADHKALETRLVRSSIRVRVEGDEAFLNIKSAQFGIERAEYEYPVPVADAREMLDKLCYGTVRKVRYRVIMETFVFEIDCFEGNNAGLVVAEIELSHANASFPRPSWLGEEVSHLPRYYNVSLVDHPWTQWSQAEKAGKED